jgi:hypothetical protein
LYFLFFLFFFEDLIFFELYFVLFVIYI